MMNFCANWHRPVRNVCALLLLVVLVGCGDAPPDEYFEIYRHSIDEAPSNLDPALASTIYSNMVVVNVFDTLYRYKYLARPYELTPNLATNFPTVSDDGVGQSIV
ncbi:MAG: hypothetical protein AAGH65_10060, partial [Pseudomonadota bacterium]